MNVIKFNKFERVAGLFVGVAVVGFGVALVSVAAKQGWFDGKTPYVISFKNADGVHAGTKVQISGLTAGSVENVELTDDNTVTVKFNVLNKFQSKVRQDSKGQLVRPFVIGERVLDISVGSLEQPPLQALAQLESVESMDLMSLMSGKELGNYLSTMSGMMENLKFLANAFLDKNRTMSFVQMFDRIDPLLKNINTMSSEVTKLARQATKDEALGTVLAELSVTTRELNVIAAEIGKQNPAAANQIAQTLTNVAALSEEFKVFIPALREVAPDLPKASRRALEALNEAVILIKAMEKSFFVRSNAKEVREEEAAAELEKKRMPASDK
jgi:phospholipid/cholesterol/gamma-HCH transport system substrate-binding protein